MMAMTKTRTGEYLNRMAQGGHFKQKLGETALALTECYCKADMGNRVRLGNLLSQQMYEVLVGVYGWDESSSNEAIETLVKAFRGTDERRRK